ncbi:MAG: helix-turn-helix domain-containing protein [Pontixanthobacter sp.]
MDDLTLEEGREAVLSALQATTDTMRGKLHYALRSWAFRALRARRSRADLDGWIELFSRVSAQVDERLSAKLDAYLELLQMAAARAEADESLDPMRGKHALSAMRCLHVAGGTMSKATLMKQLGVKQANLSYVMSPLTDAALVRAESRGKERVYVLTDEGRRRVEQRLPHLRAERADDLMKLIEVYTKRPSLFDEQGSYGQFVHPGMGIVVVTGNEGYSHARFVPEYRHSIDANKLGSQRTRLQNVDDEHLLEVTCS